VQSCLAVRRIKLLGWPAANPAEFRPAQPSVPGSVREPIRAPLKINFFLFRRLFARPSCARSSFTVLCEAGVCPLGSGEGFLAVVPVGGECTEGLDEVVHRGESPQPDSLVSEDTERDLNETEPGVGMQCRSIRHFRSTA